MTNLERLTAALEQATERILEGAWTPFEDVTERMTRGDVDLIKIARPPELKTRVLLNNIYQCHVDDMGGEPWFALGRMVHISFKRNDGEACHDWRHMQRIKNEICGPEWWAVEVFPEESNLVDTSNQYHLWCFERGRDKTPFGWTCGRLVSSASGYLGVQKQRPFEPDAQPADDLTMEQMMEKISQAKREVKNG